MMLVGRTVIRVAFYKGKLTTYSWESNSNALRWWHWSNKGWRQWWGWCRRYCQWHSALSTSHSYKSEQVLGNITRLITSRGWLGVSHEWLWMEESNLLASPMYKTQYFVQCFPEIVTIMYGVLCWQISGILNEDEKLSASSISPVQWHVLRRIEKSLVLPASNECLVRR